MDLTDTGYELTGAGAYNTSLASLRLAGCRLGPPGAAALASVLLRQRWWRDTGHFNTTLTALDLSNNRLCAGSGGVDAAGQPTADTTADFRGVRSHACSPDYTT